MLLALPGACCAQVVPAPSGLGPRAHTAERARPSARGCASNTARAHDHPATAPEAGRGGSVKGPQQGRHLPADLRLYWWHHQLLSAQKQLL